MNTVRRLSWFNRLYLLIFAGGAAACFVTGQATAGVLLLVGLAVMAFSLRKPLRGEGSDTDRVNAAQPYDERERAAGTWAFALVGMTAIMMETVFLILGVVRQQSESPAMARLLVLLLTWGAANLIAVRRV